MLNIHDKLKGLFEKALIDEIASVGRLMHLKQDEVLMDYGRQVRYMPLILSGTVKVMKNDDNGNEILLYYLGSHDSCAMAYSCCMENKLSEVRAVAEDDVELIAIPHDKLDTWLVKYPSWKSYVFNSFTQRFNELLKSVESIAFHKLDERMIAYLKKKSELSGKSSLSLSHNQIAEELGTSRVVISRLLKHLENEKKIVLYRNEIKLLSGFNQL
ncbi:MAG: Crp/Fnr family transcriptional regulator [Bacteroidota bacterium]|jgi:CRP/FNR family transcriptional regulator|nr:Crp/Fnr family transcriptional regulator [Bacteroidota bacterium]